MNEHELFMNQAIKIASDNIHTGNGGPFGAVIVKNGKIIGRGANSVTSNNDPTAHAEVMAIRDACKNLQSFQLDDCELYTSCEPCPMCLGAIYWARPKRIYFAATREMAAEAGFDDSYIYNQIPLPLDQRDIPTFGIQSAEAKAVFEEWIQSENKVPY
ncbi:MAG: nucleoside deaminase [Bacteroidales bacterium]